MKIRLFVTTLATASVLAFAAGAVTAPAVTLTNKPVYGPAKAEKTVDHLPSDYQPKAKKKGSDYEPLRGPWRVTKSLKHKGKEPVDEDGNTYACMDKECKVSRKVDEKRD
ncbi:hypothetical protein PQU92_06860 [Asticcacaulis sp. BYS171W]|uniref:Uncharacterized protein n=1 Tax=Asticcacaulis aquaticus TaxID=2984212 RepID=A0ABT5HSL7_9CAUL|nr:hypothetical protein [Asticcacaulis aquaticus]MDC7682989.1 hypothetical protein [Asticcacaulis aquaticus]